MIGQSRSSPLLHWERFNQPLVVFPRDSDYHLNKLSIALKTAELRPPKAVVIKWSFRRDRKIGRNRVKVKRSIGGTIKQISDFRSPSTTNDYKYAVSRLVLYTYSIGFVFYLRYVGALTSINRLPRFTSKAQKRPGSESTCERTANIYRHTRTHKSWILDGGVFTLEDRYMHRRESEGLCLWWSYTEWWITVTTFAYFYLRV